MKKQLRLFYSVLILVGLGLFFSSLGACGFGKTPLNLISNGSFEENDSDWSIDRNADIVLLNEGRQHFILKDKDLDRNIKFRLFPTPNSPSSKVTFDGYISVTDENGNAVLNKKNIPVTNIRVLNINLGPDDLPEKDIHGMAFREISLMDIIPDDVVNLLDTRLLAEPEGVSRRALRISIKLVPHHGTVKIAGENFNRFFSPVNRQGNLFPADSVDEWVDFRSIEKNTWSHTKKFEYLPLEGNQTIQVNSWKTSYVTQKVSGLEPGKEYLLMVGHRNIMGPVPPSVKVIGKNGKLLVRSTANLLYAQSGWTRSITLFRPQQGEILVQLGGGSQTFYNEYPSFNPPHRYANLYDDVHLYKIPEEDSTGFDKYFASQFNITPSDLSRGFKAIDYEKIMRKDFREAYYEEHEAFGLPVLDLFYDNVTVWKEQLKHLETSGKKTELARLRQLTLGKNHLAIRYPAKSKYMVPSQLKIDDQNALKAKFRFRGFHEPHFISRNKSIKISLSKKKRMYLLNPQTRSSISEPFSYFVARQLGGMGIRSDYVFLRMNDKPIGVSWRYWKDNADLEFNGRPDGTLLEESNPETYHFNRTAEDWKSPVRPQNKKMKKKYPGREVMNLFITFLREGLTDYIGGLANIDKFLAWHAHSLIVASAHQDWQHNALFYLNSADGRLEPLPVDINMGRYAIVDGSDNVRHTNPIIDKLLSKFDLFNQRDRIIWEYVSDDKEVKVAMEHYEDLYNRSFNAVSKSATTSIGSDAPFSLEQIKVLLNGGKWVFTNQIKRFNDLFGKNNKIAIDINEYRAAGDLKSEIKQVFEITIKPKNNSAWGSSLIGSLDVMLDDVNGRVKITPETPGKSKESRITFPIQEFIPSDKYFMYQVSYLWEEEYSLAMKKLEGFPKLQETIRKNYSKSGYGYTLGAEALKDPDLIDSLISIFTQTGRIDAKKEKRFIVQYEGKSPLDPLRDLLFNIQNGVTLNPIAPEVKITYQPGDAKDIIKTWQNNNKPVKVSTDISLLSKVLNNQPVYDNYSEIYFPIERFLENNPQFSQGDSQNTVILSAGVHEFSKVIILPQGAEMIIQPGTELRFGTGASLISYGKIKALGTKEKPIVFRGYDDKTEWGVIGFLHERAGGIFEHCVFQGGGEAYVNGAYFSGMLAAHYADLEIRHSVFLQAGKGGGDDGVNVKYGKATISDSYFFRNGGDAIDFDYAKPGSEIRNSYFLENENDGIDISGSEVVMHNILVSNSGDKGISLGEGTLATMDDIRVQGSKIALASKDSSKATLTHGVFSNNFIGVAAYRKKNLFKGGTIDITNTLLADNEYDFGVQVCPGKKKGNLKDCSSEISIENSKYKVRNRTFKTIIRAPTKKITSKKKFLLASWDGSLSDYGYKQVTLNDYKINKKINPLRSAQTLGPRNPLGIPSLMASLPTWTSPDK